MFYRHYNYYLQNFLDFYLFHFSYLFDQFHYQLIFLLSLFAITVQADTENSEIPEVETCSVSQIPGSFENYLTLPMLQFNWSWGSSIEAYSGGSQYVYIDQILTDDSRVRVVQAQVISHIHQTYVNGSQVLSKISNRGYIQIDDTSRFELHFGNSSTSVYNDDNRLWTPPTTCVIDDFTNFDSQVEYQTQFEFDVVKNGDSDNSVTVSYSHLAEWSSIESDIWFLSVEVSEIVKACSTTSLMGGQGTHPEKVIVRVSINIPPPQLDCYHNRNAVDRSFIWTQPHDGSSWASSRSNTVDNSMELDESDTYKEYFAGNITYHLVATDYFGNSVDIASQTIILDNENKPSITSCSIKQVNSTHAELIWTYEYNGDHIESDFFTINDNSNRFFTGRLSSPIIINISGQHGIREWSRIQIWEAPGSNYCGLEIEYDMEVDPLPSINSAQISMENTVDILWEISNFQDTDFEPLDWDFCWSDNLFLPLESLTLPCVAIQPDIELNGSMSAILTGSIDSGQFCVQDCPESIYGTLIPIDRLGNRMANGVLGVFEIIDTDDDGVPDGVDAFPNDPSESKDTDGDGVGDNSDVFPNNSSETQDTDQDGVGDNADAFPSDENETSDRDVDGVGDNSDLYPDDSTQWEDLDGDGLGDNTTGTNGDPYPDDFDNDGFKDSEDAFPLDPSEWLDTDGDGTGDEADEDDDADGILDQAELREGSDPKDPNSLPPDSFEVNLFGLTLSSFDLLGIVTGLLFSGYVVIASTTREKRYETWLEKIETASSSVELEEISKRLEQLQMLRLLGIRHVMRLEQRLIVLQTSMHQIDDELMGITSIDSDIDNPEY